MGISSEIQTQPELIMGDNVSKNRPEVFRTPPQLIIDESKRSSETEYPRNFDQSQFAEKITNQNQPEPEALNLSCDRKRDHPDKVSGDEDALDYTSKRLKIDTSERLDAIQDATGFSRDLNENIVTHFKASTNNENSTNLDLSRFGLVLSPEYQFPESLSYLAKPPLSYKLLITLALKAKVNRCCSMPEMAIFMQTVFPFYKKTSQYKNWGHSFKSNLTEYGSEKNFTLLLDNENLPRRSGGSLWTFADHSQAIKWNGQLQEQFRNCSVEIRASTPIPDIVEQIVNENLEAPNLTIRGHIQTLDNNNQIPIKASFQSENSQSSYPFNKENVPSDSMLYPGIMPPNMTSLTTIPQNMNQNFMSKNRNDYTNSIAQSTDPRLSSLNNYENPEIRNEQQSFQLQNSTAQENSSKQWGTSFYPRKPPLPNHNLITLALKTKKDLHMTVSEIYNFLQNIFPYFKHIHTDRQVSWKSTLRHTLSHNKVFIQNSDCKIKNADQLKGSYSWTFANQESALKSHYGLMKVFKNKLEEIKQATPKEYQDYLQQTVYSKITFHEKLDLVDNEIVNQDSEISEKLQRNDLSKPSFNVPANPTTWTLQIPPENLPKNDNNNTFSIKDSTQSKPEKIIIPRLKKVPLKRYEDHGASTHARPPLNFTQLCALALNCSKSGTLIVGDIYKFISQHFPYYDSNQIQGWKNSIRHTLSLGKHFKKKEIIHTVGIASWNGKSMISWTICKEKVPQLMENVLETCNKMEANIKSSMRNPEFFENFLTGPMHDFDNNAEVPNNDERMVIKEEFISPASSNEDSNLETFSNEDSNLETISNEDSNLDTNEINADNNLKNIKTEKDWY